ncbi:MAG: hypothetical protein FD144_1783 [Rhodospirillaceae bacterium]|nr:MAG: hypothetical protein FD144_1783 [Rhodospirillaceae bacterium]
MKTSLLLPVTAFFLAATAHAQTPKKPASAPPPSSLTCGVLKAETTKTGATSTWTIIGPAGKSTESGTLKSGPRFDCLDGAVLTVEFTSTAGHSFFDAYFPDGTNIGYGRQQIDRRNSRVVLPIQAKSRIAAPYRAAFDYHCKLSMPADPITPAMRAECAF